MANRVAPGGDATGTELQPAPWGQSASGVSWTTASNVPVVVTTQPCQPKFPNVEFLRPWNLTVLEKHERCGEGLCFGLCLRRQLHVYDHNNVRHGVAESPCEFCRDAEWKINVDIPDGVTRMQVRREFTCDCICCCCDDLKYSDIHDMGAGRMGSLEYIPKCCRMEGMTCGDMVIKDEAGKRAFNILKRPCCEGDCCDCSGCCNGGCCDGGCLPCLCVFSVCYPTPSCECRSLPCLVCGPGVCVCVLCQKLHTPIKVTSAVDDTHVATIWSQLPSWLSVLFTCAKPKYAVDCKREDETPQNKALFLGTAISIDKYDMTEWLSSADRDLMKDIPDF